MAPDPSPDREAGPDAGAVPAEAAHKRPRIVEGAIWLTALAFGAYHLAVISGLFSVSTMELRLLHLMFALTLLFATRPLSGRLRGTRAGAVVDLVLIAAIIAASAWMLSRWKPIAFSGGLTNDTDFWAGLVILVLVFEAARRGVGLILAVIALVFFSYPFLSPVLPGILAGRGYGIERMVIFLTTDTQGIYGIPVGVAATYIIVFTIFGAMLSNLGAGAFFFEISVRATRGLRAASAKSAVFFSTLIGMVSGSAAGNVAVTGTLTIPVMKREGYRPHQAAAIEAVASTGGQMMPPVMGAAAFIMAEIVGVPYTQIMAIGLLPALLFFASAFVIVHLQAVHNGLEVSTSAMADDRPTWRVLVDGVPFMLAFGLLIGLMLWGYSPFKASFWAMGALAVSYLVWSRDFSFGYLMKLANSVVDGARGMVPITAACAAAGIIAGTLGITGLGPKIAILIDAASGGFLALALLLTMVASIILGMGLPTTAAYLILATVVAPALVEMGIPVLTAHFFVFYYGCISTITPPVALAAYVAGGIAGANINQVGWTAARYGLTSYVLPFAFCFGPGLLLQGSLAENALAVVTGAAGIFAVGAAVVGCVTAPLTMPLRAAFGACGVLLLVQGPATAAAGAAGLTVLLLIHLRSARSP